MIKINLQSISKKIREAQKTAPEFFERRGLFILTLIFILIIFWPAYIFYFKIWLTLNEPIFIEEKITELPKTSLESALRNIENRAQIFKSNEQTEIISANKNPFR
ncbi:MAG: hypothetical protein HYV52_01025 [Parcubacteria group bacterium]|nr:hypothetical protein [Parcubacteria group bacterium]